jgi:hypothetical protein
MPEQDLVWLYVITDSVDENHVAGSTGVAGGRLRVVPGSGLAAVASTVDSDTFGEDALRRNLEDLDWLASVARVHDAVVRAVAERGAAIPLRLATIYASDGHVRELLARRHTQLNAALRMVRGRTEWGVKAYMDPEQDDSPTAAAPTTGTAYLRRRRAELSARENTERTAGKHAQAVHTALASLAVAARTHSPRNGALTGQRGREILNGAYLVDGSRSAAFQEAVRVQDGTHRGVRLVLTGPWPPYSFTTFDEAQT